jgi:AbrB family looped-hinge helix DNA binding protein
LSYLRIAAITSLAKLTTTISTKGQVILPKAIRDERHWSAGTRLVVENTNDGVLLKIAPMFPPTTPEDVFASLSYEGPARTVEDMNAGIAAEAKRRYARDRY